MMYLIDYHHHTNNSFDSDANMEDVCESALARNIQEICFTEHFSLNPKAPTYGHMNFERYVNEIYNCKEKYPSLKIKVGLEICEPHLLKDQYTETLQALDLDIILGSVHNINNQKLRYILNNSPTAYQEYFEEVYKMVCVADIDIIAHLDLMKRYAARKENIYKFQDYKQIIEKILKKAIERNIGIEINTSGLRGSLQQMLPSLNIIQFYKELGGELLTVGSDSHTADTVGENIHEALAIAKACEFEYLFKFEKRKPIPIQL